jgi:hypothetical protein
MEALEDRVGRLEATRGPGDSDPAVHLGQPSGLGPGPTADQPAGATLPDEVGTGQAAKLLGVSKDTVLAYREKGLLPFRDLAPPGSSRPDYRYPLTAVLELRTRYEVAEPPPAPAPKEPPRRREKGARKYKHLDLGGG